jgi:succinylarginine dihydrolase
MVLREAQMDGLVGLTHNYAGLSYGNVASAGNAGSVSRPRAAALQGLAKMRALGKLGVLQGVLPPQERPHLPTLRALGFSGTDAQVLAKVAKEDAVLLAQVSSASCMWTANAATVSPSPDTADGRLHLTTANLRSMLHRSIEAPTTTRVLRAIFADQRLFVVHGALAGTDALGDEGAANHTRLFDDTRPDKPGRAAHLFVYGAHHAHRAGKRPKKFPARQTLEASVAVARLHGLDLSRCVFAQQHPGAIDAGAFHNDVVCVGNGRVLLYHARAFADEKGVLARLRALIGPAFVPVRVGASDVPLALAVKTYLFNSQLVTEHDGSYRLVAPIEAQESAKARRVVERLLKRADTPVRHVSYMDVRESMRNGGGPACLRLRVPLTREQIEAVPEGVWCTSTQLARLEAWVKRHYPDKLTPKDLADPALLRANRDALDELTGLLGIGSVYEFQR